MAEGINYQVLYEQERALRLEMEFKISSLSHQLDQFKKMIFGSKSERFIPSDPNTIQGSLFEVEKQGESCPVSTTVETGQITYLKTKVTKSPPVNHPGRMKLPAHLRREVIILEPSEDITGCKKIGEEVTEELECMPGELYVNRYVRPKYLCPIKEEATDTNSDEDHTNKIVIAEMPLRPLHKCIAGPGLLAQVVVDKYVDHLPLNRQMQRFSRAGVNLPISTVTGWVAGVCDLIKPVWEALMYLVLEAGYLHADETTIKVLDKSKKGKSHQGYFWVYRDSINELVLFDYQRGRSREGPEIVLKDFQGYIQTDGYDVYEHFDKKQGITQLCCMAHARRKFHEALDNDKGRSEYALTQIKLLYDIERKCKDFCDNDRKQMRQQKAVPILEELGRWMKKEYMGVLPKSTIAGALAYSINRWDKLSLYTTDGKLQIDNNPVERSIRPVTLGRKNYLFCGSHQAAKRTAMLYSLMGTCKLHDVNPYVWLKDIISRLPSHPTNRMEELLPHIWCKQNLEAQAD